MRLCGVLGSGDKVGTLIDDEIDSLIHIGTNRMTTTPDLKPVMNIDHIAAILQVEVNTVKDYVRAGKLRAAHLGSVWMFTDVQFVQDIQRLADFVDKPEPKRMKVPPRKRQRPDLSLYELK
jgi:hypothetical protein